MELGQELEDILDSHKKGTLSTEEAVKRLSTIIAREMREILGASANSHPNSSGK
ncbi:hypothetical protein KKD19_04900 [Patescibacteria group bacterium]|nr:hypothetical protein [Patescibacteria group bacterium]MCG2693066.1 hypothetical protein [Candidatus Parcubacteria bacterium]